MPSTTREPDALARRTFAPIAPTYDRYAGLLSFGQDGRWRRFVVGRTQAASGDTVLDLACGTGSVALARRYGCSVVGVDVSPEMLREARRRVRAAGLEERITLAQASAEDLPFDDESLDALTFGYLLRYVADPAATIRELVRVVRPGGRIAGLEFGVPPAPLPRGGLAPLRPSRPAGARRARLARLARGRPRARPASRRSVRSGSSPPPTWSWRPRSSRRE